MGKKEEIVHVVINGVLRKTLGQLSLDKQYRLCYKFGFRITEENMPIDPGLHLSIQSPPDEIKPPVSNGTDEV